MTRDELQWRISEIITVDVNGGCRPSAEVTKTAKAAKYGTVNLYNAENAYQIGPCCASCHVLE